MNESKIELNAFPKTLHEALALEYIKQQDLSGKTPREVFRLYDKAYTEIFDEQSALRKEKKTNSPKYAPLTARPS